MNCKLSSCIFILNVAENQDNPDKNSVLEVFQALPVKVIWVEVGQEMWALVCG